MTFPNLRRSLFLSATVFGIGTIATPAAACYTVHLDNKSNESVKVVWVAAGCAGIHDNFFTVCKSHTVSANSSKSYNYNWGTTIPSVYVYEKTSSGGKRENGSYVFNGSKFTDDRIRKHSVPGCGKSYHITFTQEHLDKSRKSQS
ncbi:MAG: hypothetical protein AAFX54_03050 [Pseudomonadota bacterium]